jgi:hypothetical protein
LKREPACLGAEFREGAPVLSGNRYTFAAKAVAVTVADRHPRPCRKEALA